MKKKATSSDVAWHAGVSQSTVSRALSNSSQVSEAMREKVRKVAKELNYTVDKNASNLRSQHSNTIALLLFKDTTNNDSVINPFFLALLSSITNACADKGYDLLISFQQNSDDWHADFDVSNKADGLIFLGYGDYQDYKARIAQLITQGTKFVCWGAPSEDLPFVSIGCDNFKGSEEITEHLIQQGKQHIAFLGSSSSKAPEFFERYKGYCQALVNNNIVINENLKFDALYTEKSGYEAAKKLINSGERFDAICTACDLIAIGAMRALKEHKIAIPSQVAVVGFDDISIANYSSPPLTTVRQNTKLAGELLVSSLIELLNNKKTSIELIPPELIIRKSCH
ncbi:MAG: LacI family transcriptional regulator [Gammaproteobacteria bacterium]|nr:MAG: LacI family transcriptional regulator [Gammaproteobacteria bacterium]